MLATERRAIVKRVEEAAIPRRLRPRRRVVYGAVLVAIVVVASIAAGAGQRVYHATVRRELAHPDAVLVRVSAADVTIVGARGAPAVAQAHETWTGARRPSGESSAGSSGFVLRSRCPSSLHLHLWRFGARCSVRYTLRTPAAKRLGVTMDVGELHVTGIAGAFSDRTGTGDLYASSLRSARTTIVVGVGEAHLSFSRRPTSVGVRIGVGDAFLELPRGRYDIDAGASVGEVRIGPGIVQDASSPRTIVVRSSVGDVHIDARG